MCGNELSVPVESRANRGCGVVGFVCFDEYAEVRLASCNERNSSGKILRRLHDVRGCNREVQCERANYIWYVDLSSLARRNTERSRVARGTIGVAADENVSGSS